MGRLSSVPVTHLQSELEDETFPQRTAATFHAA